MDNPFIFSGYSGKEFFCDREKELTQLMNFVESGVNTTLIAQRRMGKTGLIYRLMDELSSLQSQIVPIYVDIFATRNMDDLNRTLATAILNALPESSSFGKRFLDMLKGFRPSFSIDPLSGAPQVQFAYQNQSEQEHTLEGLLLFMERQEQPVLLAIDEFQQVREYVDGNVEALLRTYIQRLHNVRFVFCGSRKHMMVDIFTNPSRPFYASTQFMGLEAIPDESYRKFIVNHFEAGGKSIDEEAVDFILQWSRRHTYYTQRLCHEVYGKQVAVVDKSIVCECCEYLLKLNEPYFLQYKQLLTTGQWGFLIALAKEGEVEQPYATKFLKQYNIGATAVARRQLQTLIDKDLVFAETTKERTYYAISDIFLMHWLDKEY
ncbi:MAG: ATP-binding protein [Bacteroidales bacterium]|nr:ATP-binding protein [Bacteroidales bacterium]